MATEVTLNKKIPGDGAGGFCVKLAHPLPRDMCLFDFDPRNGPKYASFTKGPKGPGPFLGKII